MKSAKRPNYLRIGVYAFGLAPLAYLAGVALLHNLTVNPIQNVEQRLGHYALYMLIASLAVTPVNTLFGWRQLLRHRRTIGLYACLYACLHFSVFFGVDYFFDVREVLMLTIEKPFIWLGLSGLIILIALAITSFKWWMKKMGHGWQSLHRTVYLAAVILVIHYAWAKKGNIATLSGDVLQPLILGAIVAILLILRIPVVRHWASGIRQRPPFRRRIKPHQAHQPQALEEKPRERDIVSV
jgi:methionine sulfoxide reductase heme-binding subunit